MTETWKDIPGYEGQYQVSDMGQVKALRRVITANRVGEKPRVWVRSERLLTKFPDPDGYPTVALRSNPKRVHSLVALVFIGPRPPGLDIAHGNGQKEDARASNLRYATQKENAEDRAKHGKSYKGALNPNAKLGVAQIQAIRASRGTARQVDIAKKYGISQTQVSAIQCSVSWAAV